MFFENLGKGLILFLGEGNFSFSASAVNRSTEDELPNIYVSCYEKEEGFSFSKNNIEKVHVEIEIEEVQTKKLKKESILKNEKKSIIKNENMSYLKSRGCQVLQGVDAELLHEDARLANLSFSRIIFMFPHVGGKMKIDKNRQLVLNVLKSAQKMLDRNGQVVITLCRGQGGTPFETIERVPADTWKIVETGHEAQFVLSQVYHFPHELFQQYYQVGYRGLQKGFNVEDSVVHVMELSEPIEVLPLENLNSIKTKILDAKEDSSFPVSLYPPRFIHHLSFWITDELSDKLLSQIISATVGEYVLSWRTVDRYTSGTGRQSQTIEVEYSDLRRSLGHSRAVRLHSQVLGQSLARCAGVECRL
eukprot:GFUD01022653.1.p1 GENE.GFUD01022653.1~~GFUD01022653.1.p1  ORF type:complete len:361 (+),score=81.69 GFUD01022653.1:37-1119(+)